MSDAIDRAIAALKHSYAEQVEQAATDAVTDPAYPGVRVTWKGPLTWTVEVTTDVPYGHIWEVRDDS